MNYIEALQKRYSVKKFDSGKKVPDETLRNILEAGKLSASSLGLQPYRMLVVASEEMKQKLVPAFYNPSQASSCSHIIVLVTKKEIDEHYLQGYLQHIAGTRGVDMATLEPFRNSINLFLERHEDVDLLHWNEKQSYIVLGGLLLAAALEGVDSCPMEGFIPEKAGEILKINPKKEKITVTLALGYRAVDDAFQFMKKVRKPDEKIFEFL